LKPVLHQNSAPLFDSPKLLRSVTASSSSAVLTSPASKQRQAAASASAVNIPSILEQIQCVFPADDESLPNSLFLISSTEIFHCSIQRLYVSFGDLMIEFYTEYFGQKPNDWLNYIRFYPVAC
ncbi:hypothetical protein D917_10259, partial [Trichinella nativa]